MYLASDETISFKGRSHGNGLSDESALLVRFAGASPFGRGIFTRAAVQSKVYFIYIYYIYL